MRPFISFCIVLLFSSLGIGLASARLVRIYSSDELAEMADVVINGIPVQLGSALDKLEKDDREKTDQSSSLPMRSMVARIKVIGTWKGEVSTEIQIRYSVLDWRLISGGIVNGPQRIGLEKNKRYRFYLKEPEEGTKYYTGVLEGDYDEGGAVEYLDEQESDASPPLLKKEAEEIASKYLKRLRPKYKIKPKLISSRYRNSGRTGWNLLFYSKQPYPYPSFTSDAKIIVHRIGGVDENSWVSAGFPRNAKEDAGKMIGKEVKLNVKRMIAKKGSDALVHSGEIFILRGVIKKISGGEIVGDFSDYMHGKASVPMQVPIDHVTAVQELISTH